MRIALLYVIALAVTDAAWQDAGPIVIKNARLRTVQDQYGQKLKLSYNWIRGATTKYELCVRCKFDGEEHVAGTGAVREGGTCGGPSNGCLSVKDLEFGERVTVATRYVLDATREWSKWSAPATFFIDPAISKGKVVNIESEEAQAGRRNEL